MYIFVRQDLSPAQRAVQSIHAAINAATHFRLDSLPDHPHVVLLSAKNESRLHRVQNYLTEHGVRHVTFCESDLDNQLTAVATEPVPDNERRALFKKYQLLA